MNSKRYVLSPTLWRTCRALANRRRLKIVQYLLPHPCRTVSILASALALPAPIASLYLRALNARGLLRAEHQGRHVLYRVGADPAVPQAAPILRALAREIGAPGDPVEAVFAALTGFTHARRIALVRALAAGPLTRAKLIRRTGLSPRAAARHLRKLQTRGYIERRERRYHNARPKGPLAAALLDLALGAPASPEP